MKKLVVWGYRGMRLECPPAPNGSRQTREIVAAKSRAEAARLLGCSSYELNANGSETGNAEEIAVAMSKPGTVFWTPLDRRNRDEWREAKPE